MKIVIAGAGDVGTFLAKMLSNANHDITLIDKDEEKLNYINTHFDLLTLNGSVSSVEDLNKANVKKADLFIAVTSMEEVNILAAMLSKKLGAAKTIARIDNREYLRPENKAIFDGMGIDELIYPEILAAREIVASLKQTGTRQLFDFKGGKLTLCAMKLKGNAPVVGLSIKEANKLLDEPNFRAVAITRNSKTLIPNGETVFSEGDLVYIVSNSCGLENALKFAGKKQHAIRNIMIVGGSRIGKRVAKELENTHNIKVIEIDKQKCNELADVLSNTLVINGDGRDMELLSDESIQNMDGFIAVTGNSEANILSCLLAKKMGIKRSIAEVENMDFIHFAENVGIGTLINKKLIAASYIYRFTMKADVSAVKVLTGTDAEVLEFVAKAGSKITKSKIRDLKFPNGATIGGVIRDKDSFIADGNVQIQAEDHVVVFCFPEAIGKVEKMFN